MGTGLVGISHAAAVANKTTAAAAVGNPMNEACPSQRHESAYPRSELFERRRRRMDDRAAVSSLIHARFYFLSAGFERE